MTRTLLPGIAWLGCAAACAGLAIAAEAHALPAGESRTVTEAMTALGAGSTLAFPLLADGERPELVLAQRTIDREWTTRNDPNHSTPMPGWRSEPASLALSAVLPGAGQIYSGERSGYVFALAEALGWGALLMLKSDSNDLRDQASDVAGAPTNPQSGWSFERWSSATGQDPAAIEALYQGDREAFYGVIAKDSRYQAGWSATSAQAQFVDLRGQSDHKLKQSRGAGLLLWLNHVVGAADALRAARIHNLPLRNNLDLKTSGGWQHGGPALMVTLEGRF